MRFDTTKQAKLFHMLSSSLYSDKPASIIRELCSNCHDSHIMAGKTDVPFHLVGPTFEHPYLSIKDSGVGLSAEEAVNTILCYLGSNKDTSDEFIGGWGIGSKSPFAYAKNYNVITVKNGMRAEFACWKDEHGLPSQALIDHSPTTEPNGVEIIVPVEPEDIRRFAEAIANYMEWTNYNVTTTVSGMKIVRRQPVETVVRGEAYSLELFGGGGGNIRLVYGGQSYKMDDCVDNKWDYSSDWHKLVEASSDKYDIAIIIHKPGSIDFNMNREELEQTEKTRLFVRDVVNYLSVEGNKQATIYANELEVWNEGLKNRVITEGETDPPATTLADVNDMVEKALTKGNNADRFFGKAFRVFDQKLRYEMNSIGHRLTQFTGVTRMHTLNLVIAELHTQFEFVFGRLLALTHSQRRAALGMTTRKEVIYVKADSREEFDTIIAASKDFSGLDMDKFTVSFLDIEKRVANTGGARASQPPRIYDAVEKRYHSYSDHADYVMVTPEQKIDIPDSIRLIRAEGSGYGTILFVPTADFKKRSWVPSNVYTLAAYEAKRLPRAMAKLAAVKGYSGRRAFILSTLLKALMNATSAAGQLPPLLEQSSTACIEAISTGLEESWRYRQKLGEVAFAELGKGKTRKTAAQAHALIKEVARVAEATRYIRIDRLRFDMKDKPAARALAVTLDIDKYFNV